MLIRDNRIITPVLRDAPTGAISDLVITGAGGKFTEPIDVGTFVELMGIANITANSGTNPTLDINLQYGYKNETTGQFYWVDSGDAFTQITTTNGLTIKKFAAGFGKYIRFRLLLGGTTPSYTTSLKLVAKG